MEMAILITPFETAFHVTTFVVVTREICNNDFFSVQFKPGRLSVWTSCQHQRSPELQTGDAFVKITALIYFSLFLV
jgi:hypothetical protein